MSPLIWIGFLTFVAAMIAIDLGLLNRKPHAITVREALIWTVVWISLALTFNGLIYAIYQHSWLGVNTNHEPPLSGWKAAALFFECYVLEYSLSIDNLFVIALIIASFKIPAKSQHHVLLWGVLGAVVLRGVLIIAGTSLVARFQWLFIVFGLFLIYSAGKMFFAGEEGEVDIEKSRLVRFIRRFYPVSTDTEQEQFFQTVDGVRHVTPMFLTILLVESFDLIFALDSIPAVMGVLANTPDPFLAFTSNIFAVLGLRSLYFALAGMMDKFEYLKMSLVALLAFIGVKLLLHAHHSTKELISDNMSLVVIGGILSLGIIVSLISARFGAPKPPVDQS